MSIPIFRRGAGDGLPRLKDIEHFHKKKKQSKAERLESVKEGRDEEREFGKPKKTVWVLSFFVMLGDSNLCRPFYVCFIMRVSLALT